MHTKSCTLHLKGNSFFFLLWKEKNNKETEKGKKPLGEQDKWEKKQVNLLSKTSHHVKLKETLTWNGRQSYLWKPRAHGDKWVVLCVWVPAFMHILYYNSHHPQMQFCSMKTSPSRCLSAPYLQIIHKKLDLTHRWSSLYWSPQSFETFVAWIMWVIWLFLLIFVFLI